MVKKNEDDAISSAHFGLGMWIRNNFKLWEEKSELKNWFIDNYFIDHPDDISSIILLYYYQKKNEHKIDLSKQLKMCYTHWMKYDPEYKKKIRKFKLNNLYGK